MARCLWIGVFALIAVSSAYQYASPLENPDLFQGDIIGEDEDRNAVPTKNRRWPGGVIPYELDPSVKSFRLRIRQAMDNLEKKTCVKFVPYDGKQRDYIRVFAGKGCYSYWGYYARGQQPVSLGPGCEWMGTMMHELAHALGFAHEQNRSDRDEYLTIYWENIKPEAKDQFVKFLPNQNWLINKFDYDSIMIYSEFTFSKDRKKGLKTMVPKKPGVTLGETSLKLKISDSDVERINILYDCPKKH